MEIQHFYDPPTYTLTYLVWDEKTKDAVIIDPVLDYDVLASQTTPEFANEVLDFVARHNLKVHWILETHAHADHLTSAPLLKERLGARTAIGKDITMVQETFKGLLNLGDGFRTDGSQFDRLLEDGDVVEAGSLAIKAIATPGHTPACLTFQVEDAIFTGDALFMDDYGTGRCDFPKGSASALYDSLQKLFALPDETRVFVGHDYQPGGRELQFETTIGRTKTNNPQIKGDTTKQEFVSFREKRDATLKPPRLIFQSIQVNVDGGHLPDPEPNGQRYLKIPLNLFHNTDNLGVPLPEKKAS